MNTQEQYTTPASVFDEYLANKRNDAVVVAALPENEYHAETRFISKHMLDLIADSPEKFHAAMTSTEEREATPSMILGSAFHCLVLEPERFNARFCVKPEDMDRRTKAGKEAFEKWSAENVGKEVLTAEQRETLNGLKASFFAHPLVAELWKSQGISELTVSARDENTGIPLKCRVDRIFPKMKIAVDVKTAASARPDEFSRAIANFRYDVQAAFYRDLLEKTDGEAWNFIFIATETKAPFSTAVYQISEWLPLGAACYRRDLDTLAKCMKTGEWRGYEVADDELPMPKWLSANRGF